MKKTNILSALLSLTLIAATLVSCTEHNMEETTANTLGLLPTETTAYTDMQSKTEETTSFSETTDHLETEQTTEAQNERPTVGMTSKEFANKLAYALETKTLHNTELIIHKTTTVGETSTQTKILTSVQADFRNTTAPLYSYYSTADSAEMDFEHYHIFKNGVIYSAVNGDHLQKPLSAEEFLKHTPHHVLLTLLDDDLNEIFSRLSDVTANSDGTFTAKVGFLPFHSPLFDTLLFLTGEDFSKELPHDIKPIEMEVTLDAEGALLFYAFTISFKDIRSGTKVPTTYTVQGTEKDVRSDFESYFPEQAYLDAYPTEAWKPELPEQPTHTEDPENDMSIEEFRAIYQNAMKKLDENRAELSIRAESTWSMSGISFNIPLTQKISFDFSDPEAPRYHQIITIQMLGLHERIETYYKDNYLYIATADEKYKIIMLPEYFLAEGHSDASLIFFEEDMIDQAKITKNEDGSVSASLSDIGGVRYKNEILALIAATYGDSYSDTSATVLVSQTPALLVIDANGGLKSFTIETKVTTLAGGTESAVSYHITIALEKTGETVEIPFTDHPDAYEDITEKYYNG